MLKKPLGKLGVLTVGLGAVSTTLIAGLEAIKKGLAKPIGSVSQMGQITTKDNKVVPIKQALPLTKIEDLSLLTWDIFNQNAYQVALESRVLEPVLLNKLKQELNKIKPLRGIFDRFYVKNLNGKYIKQGKNWWEKAEQFKKEILDFQKREKIARMVMVFCASTEIYLEKKQVHQTLRKFERGLKINDPAIAPSMVYAYVALTLGIPFVNCTPNLTIDIPALLELAKKNKVPLAGKDLKTGQTLIKTIIGPGLKARLLGVTGWFSNNILGNRDGEVLDDPESYKTKAATKLSVLNSILDPKLYPDLYKNIYHKVKINYYPPAGDNKEGWDNVDIFGWLSYPMQLKLNFLCRDSILAAPVVLDLILFMDLAKRAGLQGVQEWLSFYFKCPMVTGKKHPVNDLFEQQKMLENTLKTLL